MKYKIEAIKLKGQFTTVLLLPVVLFIHIRLFWCEWQSFGNIDHRDVCPLSSTVELDGTLCLWCSKWQKIDLKN